MPTQIRSDIQRASRHWGRDESRQDASQLSFYTFFMLFQNNIVLCRDRPQTLARPGQQTGAEPLPAAARSYAQKKRQEDSIANSTYQYLSS